MISVSPASARRATTATGSRKGSPPFAAPELINGQPPSAASDVYGLGATLWAALTGGVAVEPAAGEPLVAPLVGSTFQAVAELSQQGIPEAVTDLIHTVAMAREPGDRPTALELGQQSSAPAGLLWSGR